VNERRIVITGIGAITPIGSGSAGLWAGICAEKSAIREITRFDASGLTCRIAGEVRNFQPSDFLDGKALKRLDRCSMFAVAASKQAVADAGLCLENEARERIGVCIGSALGGASWAEEQHAVFLKEGARSVNPALALQMFVGAGSCNVAIELGLQGYSSSNADSCASGTIAIGNAANAIVRNDADVMFAGGAEAPLSPLCFGAFTFIKAMSSTRNAEPERACRPFDVGRDGFVMGEGAAVLVLEEREHAIKRGATIYAELAGFAATMDAHHMTAPRPDAECAARCVRQAMQKAQIAPEQIDYVNAHGSSTRLNDVTETKALMLALGESAARIPISGTKAMLGHALGASGAIEAAICCLAMRHGWIPPTLNLDTPDPECPLDYVPHRGREAKLNTVLSNSFGFGGINAALVFRRD